MLSCMGHAARAPDADTDAEMCRRLIESRRRPNGSNDTPYPYSGNPEPSVFLQSENIRIALNLYFAITLHGYPGSAALTIIETLPVWHDTATMSQTSTTDPFK